MRCPIHGETEGVLPTSGALSNCYPYVVLCDQCSTATVVIGYLNEKDEEVDEDGM